MQYFESDDDEESIYGLEEELKESKLPSFKSLIMLKSEIYFDTSSHEIKVKLNLKTRDFEVDLKKSINDIIGQYYELEHERFYIISEKMSKLINIYQEEELDESIYNSKCELIKSAIDQFCKEISYRDDLLTSTKLKQFLKIEDMKYSSLLPPKFLIKICSNLCGDELSVADFDYDYKRGIYILALNASGTVSNMGRIWSIMQKNILGGQEIFKGVQKNNSELPEMRKIYAKNFEYKILSSHLRFEQDSIDVYQAQNNGKIFRMRIHSFMSEGNTQFKEFQIVKTPILKILEFGNKLILIAEQALRLFCQQDLTVKGGGSLVSRLNNSIIEDVAFDESSQMLYLLSDKSKLFIYQIYKEWEQKYIFEEDFLAIGKFKKVSYENGNQFQMSKDLLSIYKVKFNDSSISFLNVGNINRESPVNQSSKLIEPFTCFCYDATNSFIYVGDEKGHVYIFDAKTAKLISAIFAHAYSVIKIVYLGELNSFITVSLEDVKFWRLGEITEKLTGELRKHIDLEQNDV